MKVVFSKINKSLHNLKTHIWEKDILNKYTNGEPLLNSELYSAEQMEQHGKTLAGLHILGPKSKPDQHLLSRLAENETILIKVHDIVYEAVKNEMLITPAAEWLLDNFYLIEEHIRTGKRHFPKRYSKELPKLLDGKSDGLPRVYDIAKEIISHGEGHVDPINLRRFVTSYQSITPLKLGELWAIPIMLRLAIIENLRRVAVRIAAGRADRDLANSWVDRMTETADKDPKNLILLVADMVRSEPPMTTPFVSEFVRRLQGRGPALAFPLTWIAQQLSESNQTIAQLIQFGSQEQAADQVSISNSIGSLRLISALDWREFVESMSQVEHVLLDDPSKAYHLMDFSTRDHYRHVVERIGKYCNYSEIEVAHKAIELAKNSAGINGVDDRKSHVGFYLIDKGLPQLEALVNVKLPLPSVFRKIANRVPLFLYLGSIALLTFGLSLCLLVKAQSNGIGSWHIWVLGLLLVFCCSYLSMALVNWLVTLFADPSPLPRLDYAKGIPPEFRTMVVVPTMITSPHNIDNLLEALEVRYLANQNKNLHFGLLTDFKDAAQETLEEDNLLVQLAVNGIIALNEKYPGDDKDTFFLFHRPRRWNPTDKIWMGYERKRGKLSDLNSLFRGGPKNLFTHIIGNTEVLNKIKYVITLDTDTQLPRDSARQFVGAMSHPLNKPKYDTKKQRVTEGYSILQPRVAVSLPGTNRSRYAKLFGNEPGIDPYTRAISDVYQDLFGEGSFIGKGIYDVDSFEQALKGRFAENRILSHDLLEGCYSRAGLLSDVLLFEEYPANYVTDVNRRHRWIRGDWQLLPWLLPYIPKVNNAPRKNPLSLLSWWKILDNLRRSVVPVALLTILLLGWTILLSPLFWTLIVIGIILIPTLITSVFQIFQKPKDVLLIQHFNAIKQAIIRQLFQAAFILVSLPFEAFYSMDALLRTCWRLLISKKRLLEWKSADSNDRQKGNQLYESFRTIWVSPIIAILSATYLSIFQPLTLAMVWPIIGLWFVFPAIAWWISKPLVPYVAKLSNKQHLFLRKLSRKIWYFFETFVGPDDNWLPPDNYQEEPISVIAHRTSPTNIGLSLLANLSAYDFGYIMTGELLNRISNAYGTMNIMERHLGHFYNWYDTQTLQPLRPLYVSSVDSGNLAGHLLTLQQGLISLPNNSILGLRLFEGINDTLQVLTEQSGKSHAAEFALFQKHIAAVLKVQPVTLTHLQKSLKNLVEASTEIANKANSDVQFGAWAHILLKQCKAALDELEYLVPWILHPAFPDIANKYPELNAIPTLQQIATTNVEKYTTYEQLVSDKVSGLELNDDLIDFLKRAVEIAKERIDIIGSIAKQTANFAVMDYDFIYDKSIHLQAIGYNVEDQKSDLSYYDLLASEARLSSFVAIAQDKVPQESWFALGRLLTTVNGDPVLLSWSGSMFEYLMPLLVMPTYENSLLYQTCKVAVEQQIEYGKVRGVPWGISESGYNNVDVNLNYQYRAFGVPGLGLKRGLSDDLVIAPYATAMALMVKPKEACENLERLADEGNMGEYGFYEAIDYTPIRLPRGQSKVVVKSYMAHHKGMSFLSLAYVLLDCPMQKRFEAEPIFQATMLLLQERIPKATASFQSTLNEISTRTVLNNPEMPLRVFTTPNTPYPEVKLLSNGGMYKVIITNAGGGYSHWKDIAITRWREDSTCDNWGTFCYIRDAENGNFWSTAFQPTLKHPDKYEVIFSEGRAEFRRRDYNIDTHTDIVVSPEDDIELRRVKITNRSRTKRIIDITSYAEVVLTTNAADLSHPAFSNLFVQTEIIHQRQAILCTRRPRSADEKLPWMFHLMAVHGAEIRNITYETDRMQFIGRGNSLASPAAMTNSKPLTDSEGSVLDPIVAIQYSIILEPGAMASIDIVTGISESRDGALYLVEKYQDKQIATRVFELAWTHSQVILRQINATESDAQLYSRLASSIIFANSQLRAEPEIIEKNRRGQYGLWGYAISGDLPIVLLQIEDPTNINLVRQLVQAHTYWSLKGLAVDLVIWNEDHAGYRQLLQEQIIGLIATGIGHNVLDIPGGIFVRSADQISNEDRILFQTVARVIISDTRGTLAEQINRFSPMASQVPYLKPTRAYKPNPQPEVMLPRQDLIFYNGLGGFTSDGREYVITISKDKVTPAPWVNVLANANFGTVISENGLAYTWAENAHEFRLSPWYNDPVTDSSGEAMYIRDEETGHFWSPTPLTDSESKLYLTRHGFGYSVFEHNEGGIVSELWVYVATDASVKFSVLKVKNLSVRPCKLSATSVVEWVLGDMRHKNAMHINTSVDFNSNVIFAVNPYSPEFSSRVAFLQTDEAVCYTTCDRKEFLGRNGSLKRPAAMLRSRLSGKKGAALDPCAAIQVPFDLAVGEEREIIFRLGAGTSKEDANSTINRFRGSRAAYTALEAVWHYWSQTLGTIQVETPDLSLNVLANGWLVYQTLACRIWARSGYYQSGGAFGYRDQLQDGMSLLFAKPDILRNLLLLFASRQFPEGDVQHWWHPPVGRGVRTHCSDDYLWLPLATCRYVKGTGDTGVLNEEVYFIDGRMVKPEDDSYYDLPNRSAEKTTLYNHCKKSIQHGLKFGDHGLPLIGTCDWNDGMNMVGHKGKGESVWLGFFLFEVLNQFIELAQTKEDFEFVEQCKNAAIEIQQNIEKNAWDGEWYRRAYFDSGEPLGSSGNEECQIDSISQSWSVLSGVGSKERTLIAMESANKRLVQREQGFVQLLNPPFDKSNQNPGYIKGYVPGVRENGGQYTHAAIWLAMAFSKLGDNEKAYEILSIINPINHTRTPDGVERYKVEPYVMAADVYALSPHIGRGGWTWYTGSSSWMYRLIMESVLGLKLEVDKLFVNPKVPSDWEIFKIHYRFKETRYQIVVTQVHEGKVRQTIKLDGAESNINYINLVNDGKEHLVEVKLYREGV
ncbi:GH36-type glycosyl hydrolase domain-containing protein [Williamwhitmania taraxaci]|uniref:Cellobiose phosphorylase n=1 Tax=Williamwhitmania taraxaci TaxID=1640674 RepID=A0A1G6QPX7_9BACT|nr:glucoamylase family protein [Williamwhitmania taraxaci]SDC94064.1 Cellobiose phosphorylase [Williamwhitmania taraxaci]